MEAHGAPVDDALRIEGGTALDLAAEAVLRVGGRAPDAGLGLAQGREDFLGVVADG